MIKSVTFLSIIALAGRHRDPLKLIRSQGMAPTAVGSDHVNRLAYPHEWLAQPLTVIPANNMQSQRDRVVINDSTSNLGSPYRNQNGLLIDVFEPGLPERNYGYFAQIRPLIPDEEQNKENESIAMNERAIKFAVENRLQAHVLNGYIVPHIFDLSKQFQTLPNSFFQIVLSQANEERRIEFVKTISVLRNRQTTAVAKIKYLSSKEEQFQAYLLTECLDILIAALKQMWLCYVGEISQDELLAIPEYQLLTYVTPHWQSYLTTVLKHSAREGVKLMGNDPSAAFCCVD